MESLAVSPLVVGILLCYLGYPGFRLSVLVFGMGGGACLGYVLGKGLFGTEVAAGVGAGAGALVGTLLLRLFVRAGLFLAGAGAGAAAGMAFGLSLSGILVSSLVAALLTLLAARWALAVSTALAGAALAAGSLTGVEWVGLAGSGAPGPFLVVLALFYLSGLAVQLYLTRGKS